MMPMFDAPDPKLWIAIVALAMVAFILQGVVANV